MTLNTLHHRTSIDLEMLKTLLAMGVAEGPIVEALMQAVELVVVRESDLERPGDRPLLLGMLYTTLHFSDDVAGRSAVIEAGLDPLDSTRSPFPRLLIRRPKLHAVLYVHDRVAYLVASGSASTDEERDFGPVLATTINALRPPRLLTANMSRLLRSHRVGHLIHQVVAENVRQVQLGSVKIDLTDPMSAILWTTFATVAAIERDLIVQRMAIGIINKARRVGWTIDARYTPLGYTVDVDGRVHIAADVRETVEQVLGVLADDTLSPVECVHRLGALGVSSLGPHRPSGEANIATVTNPTSAIKRLLGWAPLWLTGTWRQELRIPFPNNDTFGGLPVHRRDVPYEKPDGTTGKRHEGWVVLHFEPGLPDGGWASPEVLAALERRHRSVLVDKEPGTRNSDTLVLAGLRPADDPTLVLRADEGGSGYKLARTGDDGGGQAICRIAERKFCAAFGTAILTGLRAGFDLELVDGIIAAHGDSARIDATYENATRTQQLLVERERREAAEREARRLAAEEPDEDVQAGYRADARAARQRIRTIDAELGQLNRLSQPRVPSERLETDAAYVINAIERIARGGRVAAADNKAVLEVVQLRAAQYDGRALHCSFDLLLPTAEGVARCGPFLASVSTGTPSYRSLRPCSAEIVRALDPAVAATLKEATASDEVWRRTARQLLRDRGMSEGAAQVVCLCPVPEVAHAVVAALTGPPSTGDRSWEQLIRSTYVDGEWQTRRRTYAQHDRSRQALVDIVRAAGGRLEVEEAKRLLTERGYGPRGVYPASRYDDRRRLAPSVRRSGNWQKGRRGPDAPASFLESVRCIHCTAFADLVVDVPEIPPGLLCTACWKIPTDRDSPTFPTNYGTLRAET